MNVDESSKASRLLAWLQLMRLPNVFTAMADVAMGFWFTHESLSAVGTFLLLLVSSSCLYTAGMVINDVYDFEQDRHERPQRPLPSGRIPLRIAITLGFVLILIGEIFGGLTALVASDWRPVVLAPVLAILVLRYNSRWKHTLLGPIAMGGCRFLNVLLGMSASAHPWTVVNLAVAGGIGIYVVGVTWFARKEAAANIPRINLFGGFITMLVGMAMLESFPQVMPNVSSASLLNIAPQYWMPLWTAIIVLVCWRFVRAIMRPEPELVQRGVKTGILAIVVLDAAVVLGVRGCWPALTVLLLLVPAIALGRWVYST
jgi:4-hydroxybenzoate polyprenyltransferase